MRARRVRATERISLSVILFARFITRVKFVGPIEPGSEFNTGIINSFAKLDRDCSRFEVVCNELGKLSLIRALTISIIGAKMNEIEKNNQHHFAA